MRIVILGETVCSLVLSCLFLKDGHKVVVYASTPNSQMNQLLFNSPLKILLKTLSLWNEEEFTKIDTIRDFAFNETLKTNFNGQNFIFYSSERKIIFEKLHKEFLSLKGKIIDPQEYNLESVIPVKQKSEIISEISLKSSRKQVKFLGDLVFCFDENLMNLMTDNYYSCMKIHLNNLKS
jgi:hypothetical protein